MRCYKYPALFYTEFCTNMMWKSLIPIFLLIHTSKSLDTSTSIDDCLKEFPSDFLFGTASAAYQIEGAWNEDGKSPSCWDHFTHTRPQMIAEKGNGDTACDSYHKTEEDVSLLKHLGVHFYRFSLSWSRILPAFNKVSKEGIAYYNRVINLLLENGITPMVTLFHWDLPQYIQDLGGFANPDIVGYFEEYSRTAFKQFGDRVKLWSTFNEPKMLCTFGYGNVLFAPGINQSGIADYMCGHNLLKAHAQVYHMYSNVYKPEQKGKITLNLDSPWGEPASASITDKEAVDRYMQFEMGWFANPIFTKDGDYPDVMKRQVAKRSAAEGFLRSRLPEFTKAEIDYIKGTHDFLFLNHYIVRKVSYKLSTTSKDDISYDNDMECNLSYDDSWVSTGFEMFKVAPWALKKLLVWIKEQYGDPEIYITENGYADRGEIADTSRASYIKEYLSAVLEARCKHNVKVKAYTVWSFMDLFEWFNGYTVKLGLYHVNFSDPARPRTPKYSAEYFKKVIATRRP